MEGESLFNDGMAVVAFGFLAAFAQGTADLSIGAILIELIKVVGIGLGIGGLIGFADFLSDAALRSASGGAVPDVGFGLRHLLDRRGLRRIGGDWGGRDGANFGQFWLSHRDEPPHSDHCERVLGIFSFFCEFYCLFADWRSDSVWEFGRKS